MESNFLRFSHFYPNLSRHIRDMLRQSHLCAADCCQKHNAQEDVAKCTQSCQEKLQKAYNKMQQESEDLNGSLSRCVQAWFVLFKFSNDI